MKTLETQKGFTLVELAIVMTIIGLLIGGILKGQELMQNARVTSTIAQVRAYEAAVTTFNDKYSATPGDMTNAQTRIPGCGVAACDAANGQPANAVAGDGLLGDPGWGAGGFGTQTAGAAGNETMLFWTHLLLSDLIAGVTNAHVTGGPMQWGETHPAAKIGGGFVVGFGDGTITPGHTGAAGTGPAGMVLALVQAPNAGLTNAGGTQPLTPTRAAQIDRKMDDGRPIGGYVQAYGSTNNCFDAVGGTDTYLESITSNDCGLVFRIQG
ncbi:MAG: prepilin-type N-terminal cleavage/methylation domain-containing protein [Alphaproteobacteria bacterium]|nr:prepilin-type N-terminal cleavage/methylation domain-containing protein [Alphaproteobacteria bacterium]